jgi:pilus assembly protein CpaC
VTIDGPDVERRIARLFPGAQVSIQQSGSQIIMEGQVPDSKVMAEVLQLVESELLGSQDAANAGLGGGPPVAPSDPTAQGATAQPGAVPQAQTTIVVGGGGAPQGATPGPGGPIANILRRPGGGGIAPGTVINRIHIPGPRQIMLKVKIAELNRTALRQIGVNWQAGNLGTRDLFRQNIGSLGPIPGLAPAVGDISTTPQLVGIFDSRKFFLWVEALRRNNLATVLAEPNLVALDGQPARFQSGGSFPFPVPQANAGGGTAITIQFKDFGALLEFLPTILPNDLIRLDVEPVFSELDEVNGIDVLGTRVPGLRERRARTVVELREGQTLAIAGLLQKTTDAQIDRIPGLGDIPVFGQLFSRSRFESVETELVVLVTPILVAPAESGEMPPAPGDRVLEPNDLEFYLLGRLEGKTGVPFRSTTQYLDPYFLAPHMMQKHFASEAQWVVGPHGHAD